MNKTVYLYKRNLIVSLIATIVHQIIPRAVETKHLGMFIGSKKKHLLWHFAKLCFLPQFDKELCQEPENHLLCNFYKNKTL